ncbi:tyrosine/serine/threonine protein phosphatase pps1 [Tulasnella sp. 403]|nr:tyrosine/serine/threonine protein phosphatase pps1 [Tulasnella sp. 403]
MADPVRGLQLAPDNAPVILQRPAPHAPIRLINADQLAHLTHQYNTADVDDSVLFPFLHGLEGNNAAQNSFFSHARRGDRVKVPRYRGLVLVRVDEQGLELDIRGNVRNPTGTANGHDDEDYDETDDSDAYSEDEDHAMAVDNTVHMHPVAERRQHPRPLDTQGIPPSESSSTASTSSESMSMSISNYFPSPTQSSISLTQTSPPTTPNSSADASKLGFGSFMSSPNSHQDNSTLGDNVDARDRTPVPPSHDAPRRPSHVLTCSFHPDELLTHSPSGPVFLNPKIPDGISLRNFGIQVPIYATLADIVVYSPKGRTRAAVALAEKFKQAIEAKAVERGFVIPGSDGKEVTMSPEGVVYNVYVVSDPFETFEKNYRHLVAIDSKGNLVRKTDFMEREKEEMRNLTRASEIAENVHLGNTADVPLLADPPTPIASPNGSGSSLPVYPGLDPFDPSNNPGGYDLCIECHDMASFPTVNQLRGVEERLRALEEAWRTRVKEAQFFKDQEREQEQRRQEQLRKEELRRRREAELDLDMDMDTDENDSDNSKNSNVKVLDGTGLSLDMPPLSPPVDSQGNGAPLSPKSNDLLNHLTVSSNGTDATPLNGLPPLFPRSDASTPIPVPEKTHHHTRSRSIPSYYSQSPIGTSPRHHQKARSIPPRPPPNASQVIHLAFPSSPPATPGTLTNLIPFLHFLHSLARPRPIPSEDLPSFGSGGRSGSPMNRARSPSLTNGSAAPLRTPSGHGRSGSLSGISPRTRSQTMGGFSAMGIGSTSGRRGSQPAVNLPLSRPLKILLHAGDGYTETSVLALCYLMLTGNKTLPEAYLELQVQKSRSFFVYVGDVGILRRVEQRLKLEREREREKMAASIAATTASVNASNGNGSGASTPRANGQANGKDGPARGSSSPPPSSSNKWRWAGLPSSWRSGSLSSAGVSLLNGAGMFSSVGSSSTASLASTTSIATEEQRQALFTPPEELPTEAGDASVNGAPVAQTSGLASLAPSPELPSHLVSETPVPPSQIHPSQAHHQRVVPSQRPSSLSQSYAPGQQVPIRRARASTSPLLPSFIDHETWFNDPKFDGSFPSRVLPFLYLGNLAHAGNAYMLHALGITHVVSVGECALIPPPNDGYTTYGHNQSGSYQVTASTTGTCNFSMGRPGNGSLWVEEKEGRIKVLDIKGVCDDGIDSLRPQILPTVEWIDKARAEGGKVLVHCRVGVSRSATVTIAYVMHHLNVSLVDAYLMVRSRRLSVLIQPNMRLLYNLCGWEIELARRRAAADGREVRLGEGRQLTWPFLAREVHILNERYLS